MQRFWKKVRISDDVEACWLWAGSTTTRGYGSYWHNRKSRLAHRVSYEIHKGPIPPGLNVLHACDNPLCVNPQHLSVGDQVQNMGECSDRGRIGNQRGERNSSAKLTDQQVAVILAAPNHRGVTSALARQFGVTPAAVSLIRRGKNWRHLRPPSAAA